LFLMGCEAKKYCGAVSSERIRGGVYYKWSKDFLRLARNDLLRIQSEPLARVKLKSCAAKSLT